MTLHTEQQSSLGAGFANPVPSSQAVFRQVMNALARPGLVQAMTEIVSAPSPMMPATAVTALTLFDNDTPIWLDADFSSQADIASWLRFQTGAPLTNDASASAFALIQSGAALSNFEYFAQGTPEYPDRSTTLIVQVDTLTDGSELVLSGPGISGTSLIRAGVLPSDFAQRLQANRAQFPRGVDLLLVCGAQLVALPRSTHVAVREA